MANAGRRGERLRAAAMHDYLAPSGRGTRRRPWAPPGAAGVSPAYRSRGDTPPCPPGNGGNRQEEERIMADIGGIAADRLRTFVERIERLEEEKGAITADIREVYAEAKGTGFNAKILRQIVRLRGLDQADRREQEAMLELYKRALDL